MTICPVAHLFFSVEVRFEFYGKPVITTVFDLKRDKSLFFLVSEKGVTGKTYLEEKGSQRRN